MSSDNSMMSLADVIAGFEERIVELVRQREEAQKLGKKYQANWLYFQTQFNERPYRDLEDVSTEDLMKELNRRLDYYQRRDRDTENEDD